MRVGADLLHDLHLLDQVVHLLLGAVLLQRKNMNFKAAFYFLDLLFSFVKSMAGKITVQCVLNSQSHMLGSRPRGNANSTSGPN